MLLTGWGEDACPQVMRHFQHSAAVKDQALGLYVNAKVSSLV